MSIETRSIHTLRKSKRDDCLMCATQTAFTGMNAMVYFLCECKMPICAICIIMILKDFAKIGRILTTTLLFLIFNLGVANSSEPDSIRIIEHPLWEEEQVSVIKNSNIKNNDAELLIRLGDNLFFDKAGNKWKTFHQDSLYIFLNTRYMKDHGKYYLIDIYIQNNFQKPLFFDFNAASVTANGRINYFWTYDKYRRRVQRQNGWAAFGAGVATLFTAWILDAILNGNYFNGDTDNYSLGLDLLHGISSVFIQDIAYIGAMAIADGFERDYERCLQKSIGFLTPYNIPSNTALRGHTLAKFIPGADRIEINLPIGNKVYSFQWDASELEEINSL